jgi:hypothetical protein
MNYAESSEEPLLRYSEDCERASFIDDDDKDNSDSMPRKKSARKGRKKARKTRSRKVKQAKGVRFVKGRVALRVAGLGLQRLGASELVRYISLSKLKTAAKKFLQSKGVVKKRRKSRKRSKR